MITQFTISPEHKSELMKFLKKHLEADAVEGYCAHIEHKFKLKPIACPREKVICQSLDDLIHYLESHGKLWRETEITIQFGKQSVNENTKKIYICPFCSKAIGENMDANPADWMYEHVAKCKSNNIIVDGLPVKKFLVSEDPDMIKEYITERKASVKKVVYTSASGKLFNSKAAVLEDFKKNQVKPMTLYEVVQNPREFTVEGRLASLRDEFIVEEKIIAFLEALSKFPEFEPYVKRCQEG
jgi:hypothetical protein